MTFHMIGATTCFVEKYKEKNYQTPCPISSFGCTNGYGMDAYCCRIFFITGRCVCNGLEVVLNVVTWIFKEHSMG